MSDFKKVQAMQDESSHWYIIPNEEADLFNQLSAQAQMGNHEAEEQFIEIFDKYMTGGDLNNKQLYIKYPEQ